VPKPKPAFDFGALEAMDDAALKALWRERFACEPPRGRTLDLVRREIAWRVQAAGGRDLDPASRRLLRRRKSKLNEGDAMPPIALAVDTGETLVREWRGVTHTVRATKDGYIHNGRTYRSLSAVACTITGAKWSGPRFFKLADGA
jgi:hypothetical protein